VTVFNHDELYKLGKDKNFDILNLYIDKVGSISILKWTSVSEHSINMKAKDVKRLLVKAVDQIPLMVQELFISAMKIWTDHM
jgi:hypothetical protein